MGDTLRLVKVGPVDKVPPGQGLCFIVGDEQVAVFRQRDGKLFATQNRCPHKGAPLSEGLIGSGQVICPFHAHKFDLCSGEGPGGEQLKVYPVKEKDGQIVLTLEPAP